MNQDIQNIFQEYLNSEKGNNRDIERRFARLFCKKANDKTLRSTMQDDWEKETDSHLDADLQPLLYRLNFLINSENSNAKISHKPEGLRLWSWYSRIAAVLLLPLMVWTVINYNSKPYVSEASNVEVEAPLGSRIHVKLPDGSSAWLNSGSHIKYGIPFRERRVEVEGEAYFEVRKDSLRPMIVDGPRTQVKVLGTKFNVKMWPGEELTEVVLAEGKVSMMPKGFRKTFEMKPGDMFVFNKANKHLKKERVNPEYYSAWIDGKLVLRGINLEQVARELSRWFNVDVELADVSLKDHVIRATFEDEKLEEVLRLLKLTAPVEYKIIDQHQQENGDFSRKKVIIMHK